MDRLSHCSVFLCTSHAVFEFFFFFFLMIRRPPRSTLFPYTRSSDLADMKCLQGGAHEHKESGEPGGKHCPGIDVCWSGIGAGPFRPTETRTGTPETGLLCRQVGVRGRHEAGSIRPWWKVQVHGNLRV